VPPSCILLQHVPTALATDLAGASSARTAVSSDDAPATRNELPDSAAGAQRLDGGPQADARAAAGASPPPPAVSPVQPAVPTADGAGAVGGVAALPVSMSAHVMLFWARAPLLRAELSDEIMAGFIEQSRRVSLRGRY